MGLRSYIAYAAYSFVPNDNSKESAFSLCVGEMQYTLLVQLLNPKLRDVSNDTTESKT